MNETVRHKSMYHIHTGLLKKFEEFFDRKWEHLKLVFQMSYTFSYGRIQHST